MKEQLLFVYNADSGLFSTVTDFAHKILSPSTYKCQLCALTYGNFAIKQEWKSFVENLPLEAIFLHKNEFENQVCQTPALPAILLHKQNGSLLEMVSKTEIESCKMLYELESIVLNKIHQYVQHHHSNL